MDIPALIQHAQQVLGVNEAGLARRLEIGQPTVNRWVRGGSTPDFASCLVLARVTGIPAVEWLAAAGHDPKLLAAGAINESPSPVELDLRAREAEFRRALEALEDVPEPYWKPYLRALLDNERASRAAFIDMVTKIAKAQAAHPVNTPEANPVNTPDETANGGNSAEKGPLTHRQRRIALGLSNQLTAGVAAL